MSKRQLKRQKANSYIAQYPVLRTVQSVLHFTSLTDLFTQTPSRLLWEASSHMLQLMREGYSYTYPSLSIARYLFIQLSELEQCRLKKLAQGFNTSARIRTRVLSRESEALPLSHCALHIAPHPIINCSWRFTACRPLPTYVTLKCIKIHWNSPKI